MYKTPYLLGLYSKYKKTMNPTKFKQAIDKYFLGGKMKIPRLELTAETCVNKVFTLKQPIITNERCYYCQDYNNNTECEDYIGLRQSQTPFRRGKYATLY